MKVVIPYLKKKILKSEINFRNFSFESNDIAYCLLIVRLSLRIYVFGIQCKRFLSGAHI